MHAIMYACIRTCLPPTCLPTYLPSCKNENVRADTWKQGHNTSTTSMQFKVALHLLSAPPSRAPQTIQTNCNANKGGAYPACSGWLSEASRQTIIILWYIKNYHHVFRPSTVLNPQTTTRLCPTKTRGLSTTTGVGLTYTHTHPWNMEDRLKTNQRRTIRSISACVCHVYIYIYIILYTHTWY